MKRDPHYHVYFQGSNGDWQSLTSEPIAAPNAKAAVKAALADDPAIEGGRFLVVPARSHMVLTLRRETTTVDLWEPLPQNPLEAGDD